MKQIYLANTDKNKNKSLQFQSVGVQSRLNKSNILQMKFIKLFFISVVLISLVWSCKFLDYNESASYSKEEIFYYQSRAKNVLTNIYSYLPNDFNSVDGAIRSSASDDAVDVWDMSDIQKFNDGSWNSTIILDNAWSNMYRAIRAANIFIDEATGLTFPEEKWNEGFDELMQAYNLYTYEARFLRAFFYFELIKRYNNVPLITTEITTEEANKVSPASFDDIVGFIVGECDTAAANLPDTYTTFISLETGRATKGAALALKARTLLYAASPLHNATNDKAKWIAAAKAAKEIIDSLASYYTPLEAYSTVVNNLRSIELIFERRQGDDRAFEEANTAVGFIGGNTGTCPTQNLVDSYEMKATGLGINDAGSGYVSADPYNGRDPRLAMTVLYNGSTWKTLPVETWNGGLNGPPKNNVTKTGYYLKKYLVESISLDPINMGTARHVWVIFRYAEVLLNYAEAMNEAYGPEVPGQSPLNNLTALDAVNIVRARTGVEMPAFPAGMDQSAFREKLRNERRVELAFEDHRFWDIRRWKIGPSTITIRGLDLTKNAVTSEITYTPKVVETRVWNDKMYLYPIPQNEYFINNNLGQNPGW